MNQPTKINVESHHHYSLQCICTTKSRMRATLHLRALTHAAMHECKRTCCSFRTTPHPAVPPLIQRTDEGQNSVIVGLTVSKQQNNTWGWHYLTSYYFKHKQHRQVQAHTQRWTNVRSVRLGPVNTTPVAYSQPTTINTGPVLKLL